MPIRSQLCGSLDNFVHQVIQEAGGELARSFNKPLDDPAPELINSHLLRSSSDGSKNKVDTRTLHHLADGLHDMIAVHIVDAIHDSSLQLGNEICLLITGQEFQHPLHDTAAVLVDGQAENVAIELVHDGCSLLGRRSLDQSLHDEVAVLIGGQACNVRKKRLEYLVSLSVVTDVVRKSPLQEAAAVLILRSGVDAVEHVL
mmetsp:Transcript_53268/g.152683  ORF Transcript_53268/g.152683 Transcript_53268/m.152683 type:complete len:201 (+) Transcript_53268:590-1192(+)